MSIEHADVVSQEAHCQVAGGINYPVPSFPSSIRIGPLDYDVSIVDDLEDGELLGQIDYVECKISISSRMKQQHRIVSLWHEILHAIYQQSGREEDESMIATISHGIAQVMRDNPEL